MSYFYILELNGISAVVTGRRVSNGAGRGPFGE